MQKMKYIESLIAMVFIPIMIELHNYTPLVIAYDWIIYLLFNGALLLSLILRTCHDSNIVLVKNIFTFSYSVVTSLCLAVFFIEKTHFFFALIISICGGGIIGSVLSVLIIFFRKLFAKNIVRRQP